MPVSTSGPPVDPQIPVPFCPSRWIRPRRKPSMRVAVFPEQNPARCSRASTGARAGCLPTLGLPSVFVRSIVIDSVTPSTNYAGTSGGVFKSTNGGGNWSPANNGLVVLSVITLAMDPQNPAVLYVGTTAGSTNGVFKSTNGGGNWTPVGTGLPNGIVNSLAVDPQSSSTVYAGTQFGLFKSISGGAANSWTPINNGFTPSPSLHSHPRDRPTEQLHRLCRHGWLRCLQEHRWRSELDALQRGHHQQSHQPAGHRSNSFQCTLCGHLERACVQDYECRSELDAPERRTDATHGSRRWRSARRELSPCGHQRDRRCRQSLRLCSGDRLWAVAPGRL